MALDYILRRVKQKSGLPDSTAAEREFLLDVINEAAEELYEQNDWPGCLAECVFPVYPNQQLSLPTFVGKIRAVREYESMVNWKLSTLRPRYHDSAWVQDGIRNWREVGVSPVAVDIDNGAPVVIVTPVVENPPVEITIVGATHDAENLSDTIILNATRVSANIAFERYIAIKKNRVNRYNIVIEDADGQEISIIYNNELNAQFTILDVSSSPLSPADNADSAALSMEVLYKKKLSRLINDTDEFPVLGYDSVIVDKALQLLAEDDGNIEKAAMKDKKANRSAQRKSADALKGKQLSINIGEHPHNSVFRHIGRGKYLR